MTKVLELCAPTVIVAGSAGSRGVDLGGQLAELSHRRLVGHVDSAVPTQQGRISAAAVQSIGACPWWSPLSLGRSK